MLNIEILDVKLLAIPSLCKESDDYVALRFTSARTSALWRQSMPDPITGVALAKAAASAVSADAGKDTTSLLKRLLGPAVDEFGAALGRSMAYKTRNFGRIVERADAKARAGIGQNSGVVGERVAYTLLEDGSLCDDELMRDYLGGLLAGSRCPDGRDDRAVAWSRVITGMSWLQVRAHYLLYREWAARLHGTDFDLGINEGREVAMLDADLVEFSDLLTANSQVGINDGPAHSIFGLISAGLLDDNVWMGRRENVLIEPEYSPPSIFDLVLRVYPTVRGFELYGWAQGLNGLTINNFATEAVAFETEPPIPRLMKVSFPKLEQQHASTADVASRP